jgi:hypothetical protein
MVEPQNSVISRAPKMPTHQPDGVPLMLWTILIILVIIAVALWIFSRLRGGRGV